MTTGRRRRRGLGEEKKKKEEEGRRTRSRLSAALSVTSAEGRSLNPDGPCNQRKHSYSCGYPAR